MAYGIVFCLLLQGDVVQAIAQCACFKSGTRRGCGRWSQD